MANTHDIKVPPMGESITEATVADWHVQPGQGFDSGDILVELETDKVTMEVPAPVAGTLKEIKKESGVTVNVDEILAVIEEGAAGGGSSSGGDSGQSEASGDSSAKSDSGQSSSGSAEKSNDTLAPGAQRLAAEKGVNPDDVQGSGKRGQVTKSDIVDHLEKGGSKKSGGGSSQAAPAPAKRTAQQTGEREEVVPMSRLRQRIAERLVEAQHTAAILTTFNEVDMHNMMNMRSRYKEKFKDAHGVGLGFMSFFAKACVDALKAFPGVNAEIRDTNIIYKNYYDIGVAVGGPKGLVVPIVRDVDQLSFAGVEAEIVRLAGKVKEGTLGLDELQGGTFTISNGGIYGSMMSTPILNPPQSGILGMHNIVKKPVVVNDEIVIRPMMYLALSYDHRVVDGKEAVGFLVRVKECIENPERMLLDI
ncbi:MAG: 2-oxoglutarate dehydrogenase complex dihydrolipoyllysine-residue succinyltransferase [bacterium]|nr:2-oxoglutarate dehydrogenase complex dihydrolipoyllysine-residue succinyltransferase [bacterium]